MHITHLKSAIEALLLVHQKPLAISKIKDLIDESIDLEEYRNAAQALIEDYRSMEHGIEIINVSNGLQFRTKLEHRELIRSLFQITPVRLSQALLEVLSIVSFNQPVTREQVEQIRGVECGHHLRNLMDKKLIKMVGRSDAAGRPMLYGTTREFLELFGLESLKDLPTLREIEDMLPANEVGESVEEREQRIANELGAIVDDSKEIEFSDLEAEEDALVEELDEKDRLAKEAAAAERAEKKAAKEAAEAAKAEEAEASMDMAAELSTESDAEQAEEEAAEAMEMEAELPAEPEADSAEEAESMEAEAETESEEATEVALAAEESENEFATEEAEITAEMQESESEAQMEAEDSIEALDESIEKLDEIIAHSEEAAVEAAQTTVETTEGEDDAKECNSQEQEETAHADGSETSDHSETQERETAERVHQQDEIAGSIAFGSISAAQEAEWELDEVPVQANDSEIEESAAATTEDSVELRGDEPEESRADDSAGSSEA